MLNNINSRRGFFKNLLLASVTIIPLSSFIFKKSKTENVNEFKTLTKEEADDIIKNEKFYSDIQIKPESAPIRNLEI